MTDRRDEQVKRSLPDGGRAIGRGRSEPKRDPKGSDAHTRRRNTLRLPPFPLVEGKRVMKTTMLRALPRPHATVMELEDAVRVRVNLPGIMPDDLEAPGTVKISSGDGTCAVLEIRIPRCFAHFVDEHPEVYLG